MIKLLLFRHAKSLWDEFEFDDFSRNLNKRGKKNCAEMGVWAREAFDTAAELNPDVIYCSTAKRARETWKLFSSHLQETGKLIYDDDLYLATSHQLLNTIKSIDPVYKNAMIIGHNPGLGELANSLCQNFPENVPIELFQKFPTAALAIIEFPGLGWHEIGEQTGQLTCFVSPKILNRC